MSNLTTAADQTVGQSYQKRVHPLVHHILRSTLALVFLAFGYVKFFLFEADGVEPLIASHPALNWLLPLFGKMGASAFLSCCYLWFCVSPFNLPDCGGGSQPSRCERSVIVAIGKKAARDLVIYKLEIRHGGLQTVMANMKADSAER